MYGLNCNNTCKDGIVKYELLVGIRLPFILFFLPPLPLYRARSCVNAQMNESISSGPSTYSQWSRIIPNILLTLSNPLIRLTIQTRPAAPRMNLSWIRISWVICYMLWSPKWNISVCCFQNIFDKVIRGTSKGSHIRRVTSTKQKTHE